MERVLIAASKGSDLLQELLLSRYPGASASVATNGSQARRLSLDLTFDLAVVSAPLPDENGVDLSVQLSSGAKTGVILLVKGEYADAIAAQVEDFGVFVVEKPLHKPFFYRSLGIVHASVRKLQGLQTEKQKLQDKIEEMRLVNRAKFALMQYLGLTEPQAHRYIEKQAMDMREPKREIAQSILRTYEP